MTSEQGRALAEGICAALPGWVEASVERLLVAYRGATDPVAMAAARQAGQEAAADVGARVRALLETDIDAQASNPLGILRDAVHYPTDVLRAAGVPPVVRDGFSEDRFPDDDYDLTPTSFADLDPSLLDLGLAWGAAKAWEHKARHTRTRPATTSVAAYVPDLMDRSKVAAAAPGATFVPTPAALVAAAAEGGAELVVVDLSRPGVLDAVAALAATPGVRTIGFGSHVDHELLAAATAAGCREVLPRSRFFAHLGELLAPPPLESLDPSKPRRDLS